MPYTSAYVPCSWGTMQYASAADPKIKGNPENVTQMYAKNMACARQTCMYVHDWHKITSTYTKLKISTYVDHKHNWTVQSLGNPAHTTAKTPQNPPSSIS